MYKHSKKHISLATERFNSLPSEVVAKIFALGGPLSTAPSPTRFRQNVVRSNKFRFSYSKFRSQKQYRLWMFAQNKQINEINNPTIIGISKTTASAEDHLKYWMPNDYCDFLIDCNAKLEKPFQGPASLLLRCPFNSQFRN
jgi:hypothetical protein